MRRFVQEADREQWTLLPECLEDFIAESNPVRVIDVLVEALDLAGMNLSKKGALRKVCARFVEVCREMGLLAKASVAIIGSGLQSDTGHEHRRY